MQKIVILPFDRSKDRYGHRGLLVDDHVAITADGDAVYLVVVKPTESPYVYRSIKRGNFIPVARGGKSTAYLKHVVTRLKTLTAYELLTEHYINVTEGQFDVMQSKVK